MAQQPVHTASSCWPRAPLGRLPGTRPWPERRARSSAIPAPQLMALAFLLLVGLRCCASAMVTACTAAKLASAVSAPHTMASAGSGEPDVACGGSHALRGGGEAWGRGGLGHQDVSTDVNQLTQSRDTGGSVAHVDPAAGRRQQQQQQQERQQHRNQQLRDTQRLLRKQRQLAEGVKSTDGSDDMDGDDAEMAAGAKQEGGTQSSSTGPSSGPASNPSSHSSSSSRRCVFILGTGRSGSTALMDALNQLPHFLIRGEQEGAFWYLYLTHRCAGFGRFA